MKNLKQRLKKILKLEEQEYDRQVFNKENEKFYFELDEQGSDREKLIFEKTRMDYIPYYRTWLNESSLQVEYDFSYLKLLLSLFENENFNELNESPDYDNYKRLQSLIGEDMKKNPSKYESLTGDAEW